MALPKFTVTGNLYDIPGLISAGQLVTHAIADQVTFVCNLGPNDFFTWAGGLYRAPHVVVATVNVDGSIDPQLLLANDPGLNVTGLQWRIDIGKVKFWWFPAGANGTTVDLATVSRVPSARVNAVAGATMAEIVAAVGDVDSGLRTALEAAGIGGGGVGGVSLVDNGDGTATISSTTGALVDNGDGTFTLTG